MNFSLFMGEIYLLERVMNRGRLRCQRPGAVFENRFQTNRAEAHSLSPRAGRGCNLTLPYGTSLTAPFAALVVIAA